MKYSASKNGVTFKTRLGVVQGHFVSASEAKALDALQIGLLLLLFFIIIIIIIIIENGAVR